LSFAIKGQRNKELNDKQVVVITYVTFLRHLPFRKDDKRNQFLSQRKGIITKNLGVGASWHMRYLGMVMIKDSRPTYEFGDGIHPVHGDLVEVFLPRKCIL
jgi:hypothetical protein